MIPKKEEWHYLAVKNLSALLIGITSKDKGDFHCLNFPHYFRTKGKLESHKKVCNNKDFCSYAMPSQKTNISDFEQYQKSDKLRSIIYADP